jgi:hypothetical protein
MKRVALIACALVVLGARTTQAQENPHGKLRLDIDCTACHTPAGWKPMRAQPEFDHGRQTGFVLTGKHANVSCASCHGGLSFDRPRARLAECASCHLDVHRGRLGQSCSNCHNTDSFARAASTNPHARTSFPLTGAHAQVPCESCHRNDANGAFTRLDASCMSCHRADYNAARMPDHAAGGFSLNCQQCHSMARWEGAAFDHAAKARGFALTKAHVRIMCASCHAADGKLIFPTPQSPADCVSCHRADYERQHGSTGFSTSCTTCHSMNSWKGAVFDHQFPINSGRHRLSCAQCHPSPANMAVFTCTTGCHSKTGTDAEHRGRANYVYDSVRCLACHPRGN